MAIQFDCPYCTASIRVPDAAQGKKGSCPKCGTKLLVPMLAEPAQPPAARPVATPPSPAPTVAAEESPAFPAIDEPTTNEPAFPAFDSPADGPPPVPPKPQVDENGLPVFSEPASPAETSVSRALKRRKRTRHSAWAIPVAFGSVLLAIGGWFWWKSDPKLEGDLKAERIVDVVEPKIIGQSLLVGKDIDTATVDRLLKHFTEERKRPIRVADDQYMYLEINGTLAGLSIYLEPGKGAELFRVDVKADKTLREYYKDNVKQLEDARLKQLSAGARAFLTAYRAEAEEGAAMSDVSEFAMDLAVPGMVGGLGYNLHAVAGRTKYPCVYEDEDGSGVYFVLPKGTTKFTIRGRELSGKTLFPGRYTVEVTGTRASKTAKKTVSKTASEQTDAPPAKTDSEPAEKTTEKTE